MTPVRRPPLFMIALAILALATEVLGIGLATRARAVVLAEPERIARVTTPAELLGATPIIQRDAASGSVRFLLVRLERPLPITARPGVGRVVGAMPAGSRYYGVGTVAWVHRTTEDGRFGLVDVPYTPTRATGWIRLRGLERSWTRVRVIADLSEHRLTVWRGGDVLFHAPAATGAPASPTPAGRYFVTDRVAFPGGGALGTFAFGLSGIQPRLPAGWSGGDQLAIHGTNAPSTIGRSASAGCLRVSESTLHRLRPLLRLGTPVLVRR
jgi:lipoprotein-anchoring transpeptidase ErfK/SrfK